MQRHTQFPELLNGNQRGYDVLANPVVDEDLPNWFCRYLILALRLVEI